MAAFFPGLHTCLGQKKKILQQIYCISRNVSGLFRQFNKYKGYLNGVFLPLNFVSPQKPAPRSCDHL